MQLASITFDGEKKNDKHYIIPASYFKKKGITPIPVTKPNATEASQVAATNAQTPVATTTTPPQKPVTVPKISLDQNNKRRSGLSLSSIRAKKEHQTKQIEVEVEEQELPKEPFTPEALIACWEAFTKLTTEKGKHNLASILAIDTPKVEGTTIHIVFPNETNKLELERQQYELMGYLRKSLKNYDINLSITVNEAVSKKYAYTDKDKYEKLKDKNAAIETLRRTFDLDI